MRLTVEELAALPAKTKKHPDVMALYLEHDYLTAYAMHTDRRVADDGYQGAVGAVKDWERHGALQFGFLMEQGLRPDSTLLEIGCGTGRLARKVVPYLNDACYAGLDISKGALHAARDLARLENWDHRLPDFTTAWPTGPFDFIWAFSVFIHLPADLVEAVMRSAALVMHPRSRFMFSYVPERVECRTGLKQFRHTIETYHRCAWRARLSFVDLPAWTGEQRIAVAMKG